jgi:luciferase family oxidoreductase group 1
MIDPRLSVLDLVPLPAGSTSGRALRNSLDLAQWVDRLGYHRFWLAEHHNLPSIVSTSPEILIGLVASVTRAIRVGSGGIMLPNHAPLRIAEAFRVLEALNPGRIDLGLGRAPGSDGRTALALRRSVERVNADDFPDLLDELLAFGSGKFPPTHPFRNVRALPDDVPLPPIWILGSSDYGARLAARRGFGFGFAHHFSAEWALPAARAYRENFQSSDHLSIPHLILTVAVVCAETDAEANHLASTLDLAAVRRARGEFAPLVNPDEAATYPLSATEKAIVANFRQNIFVGSPDTVRAGIERLRDATQADEIMVTTMLYDHAARRRSYELLADVFAIPDRAAAVVGQRIPEPASA